MVRSPLWISPPDPPTRPFPRPAAPHAIRPMMETTAARTAGCDAKRAGGVHEGVEIPDALLVERARAGDTRAFQALVDRHYADFLRYATRMLGNPADAEEAVQDALIRAYRALPRYQDQGKA